MLNFFIILIITSSLLYSQNYPQSFDYFKSDSSKTENSPFHYLTPDSLGWKDLPQHYVFKYFPKRDWKQSSGRILVYRPDSSIIFNMPEFIPDSAIKYNIPKAQPKKEFPIVVPKDFKNEHPKNNFKRKRN